MKLLSKFQRVPTLGINERKKIEKHQVRQHKYGDFVVVGAHRICDIFKHIMI